jgi:PAS domain S-box-containing protein
VSAQDDIAARGGHSEEISDPQFDASELNLADLVDAPLLKSMMDDFYELTSIPMSLLDLDGNVVVGAGWQDACTRFHRANPETCANCVASDTILAGDIPAGEMRLYRCKNGMWDAATPVMVKYLRVGNVFTGQFFFDDETVDLEFFREQARRYGFDEQEYLAAIESVPRLNRTAAETGLRFLTKLSSMISRLSISNAEKAEAEAELQQALGAQTTLAEDLAAEWAVLQAIMENTDTLLAYLDADFNFVAVNSTYALSSGYPEAELIGRNHFDLFPDPENESIFERARDSGESVRYQAKPFEFPNQPWRGVTYWDWRLTPVKDREDRVQGFAFSLLDVTRTVRQRVFSDATNRINDVIHSNLDFGWILEQIVPELAAATGSEFVAIALQAPGGQWRLEESFGLPEHLKGGVFGDAQLPGASDTVRLGRPIVLTRAEDSRLTEGIAGEIGVQSLLAAPLSVPGQTGAVAYGYLSGPGEFDENAIDFAGKIASSLSLALSNSRLLHDAMDAARLSGALAKIDEILLSALTYEDVVARLVGEVSKVAGARRSLVIRVSGDDYTVTHVRGVSEDVIGVVREASYYPAFALAASQKKPVLIEDTWNDPRTNKEFVVPNELRAFQLLPLMTEGSVTHVLALVYDEPRSFDEGDSRSAERMAGAMSLALTNASFYERERRIADRLQGALLALPDEVSGVEFSHAYHSASDAARVGGDFYDIFEIDRHCVGVTVGDVAGKGLDAAVLTSLAKNTVRAHASEKGKTPSQVLALTNDLVYRATSPEAFVTLFFGVLDCRDGRLAYANAGHTAAAVVRQCEALAKLPVTGPLLGAFPGVEYAESDVRLGENDVLFLYTDGLTEARRDGVLYGEDRLCDFLSRTCDGSAKKLVEEVVAEVFAFSDGRLRDDLAILAVKRLECPSEAMDPQETAL